MQFGLSLPCQNNLTLISWCWVWLYLVFGVMDFEPHRNPATVKYEYSAVIIRTTLYASGSPFYQRRKLLGIWWWNPRLFQTPRLVQDFAAMIIQYCTFKTLEQEENVQRLGNSLQLFWAFKIRSTFIFKRSTISYNSTLSPPIHNIVHKILLSELKAWFLYGRFLVPNYSGWNFNQKWYWSSLKTVQKINN